MAADTLDYCAGCAHRGKVRARWGDWWCKAWRTWFGSIDVTACSRWDAGGEDSAIHVAQTA